MMQSTRLFPRLSQRAVVPFRFQRAILPTNSNRFYATAAKPEVTEAAPKATEPAQPTEEPSMLWSLFPGSVHSSMTMRDRGIELLDMVPGKTRADKAGLSVLGMGLAAYLNSQNVVNLDDQSIWTAALVMTIRFLYVAVSKPVTEYFEKEKAREMEAKEKGVASAMKTYVDYMSYMETHKDLQGIVSQYYTTCKETEKDLVEHAELMRRNLFLQRVKDSMDAKLKYDNRLVQVSRERIVGHTMDRVQQRLSDPAVQSAILNQCLEDLKAVKTKA